MINVIAEIGWNFIGDMSLAKDMIHAAKKAGANTVKFQYWDPANLKSGAWDEDGRREIYNKAKLSKERINILISEADKVELKPLFSVFSKEGAEFIRDLKCKAVKIPSHEAYNKDLINYCVDNFSEVFISLGALSEEELLSAVKLVEGKDNVNLMHCVSSYPCPNDIVNLPKLSWIKSQHAFCGLSDHSPSLISGAMAVALGVTTIEKHFTTDKNLPGRDNKFALDEPEMTDYVSNIRAAEQMMLDHGLGIQSNEKDIVANYRGRWSA